MRRIFTLLWWFMVSIHGRAQTVHEIIVKHLDAVGGRERIASLQNVRAEFMLINKTGKKDSSLISLVEKLPHFQHRETFSPDGRTLRYEFYANEAGSSFIFYRPFPMTNSQKQKIASAISHSHYLFSAEKKLKRVGDQSIDGISCYAVKAPPKDSQAKSSTTYYIDKATGNLLASSSDFIANNTTFYKDWREVNGIRFPFVEEYFLNGTLISRQVYREIEFNVSLESYSFQPTDPRGHPLRDTTSRFHKIEFTDPAYSNTTLQQFVTQFRGKTVLVDVWATWCGPCKVEFTLYDDDFYRFLKTNDVEMLFLSIDQQGRKESWKQDVDWFNLNGYHAHAGKALISSIGQEIYEGKTMYIPRYFLVDPFGKIISKDLGKPSAKEFRDKLLAALKP